jgi:transcriptional regulator with XRE-family HTH domain
MNPMDIKRIRLMLGWSQERLARELGVSFCTVNRWERDKTTPSPMALRVLKRLRDKADQNNRRTSLRLGLHFPVHIERLGGNATAGAQAEVELKAKTEDISIGGLMFRAQDGSRKKGLVQIGERLKIDLEMGHSRPVEAFSKVIWAMDKGSTRRFGVKFDDITPGHRVDFMNTLLINNPF